MPPAPLVWKRGCEVAKWRSGEVYRKIAVAKWRSGDVYRRVGHPGELPEAPGGAQTPELQTSPPLGARGLPRMAQNIAFSRIWGLPGGGQKFKLPPPPGRVTRYFLGPGERLQKGSYKRELSLRTSEFWRPDLGDLEAKNLDSLVDYSLVAKSRCLNSLVAHKGAGGLNFGTW